MQSKITDWVRIKNQKIYHGNEKILALEKDLDLNSFLKKAYKTLEIAYPKYHKMDGLSKLGILATEVLLKNNPVPSETALVFSNSSSSLETDRIFQESMNEISSPAVFVYTLPNIVMGEISIRYGLLSENVFFVTEEFNTGLITDYTEILLKNLTVPAVVCAWIEWKNAEYDVFLCLISRQGNLPFTEENLKEIYFFENE